MKIDDFLLQSAQDIITLLRNPPPLTVPSLQAGDTTKNALLQLATLLHWNPLSDTTLNKSTQQTLASTASSTKPDSPTTHPLSNHTTCEPLGLTQALVRLARVLKQPSPEIKHPTTMQYPPQKSFEHRAAQVLLANHLFGLILTPKLNHVYDDKEKKLSLDELLQGDQKNMDQGQQQ